MDTAQVATVALAVIALAAVLLDHYRQRRHDRLLTLPALVFHCDTSKGEAIRGLWLQNSGMGAARITGTVLKLDGEAVGPLSSETWTGVLEDLALSKADWLTMNIVPDPTTVGPGEKVKILCLSSPTAPKELEALLLAILSRLEIDCEYESIHGQRNTSDWAFGSDPVGDEVIERLTRKAKEHREEYERLQF